MLFRSRVHEQVLGIFTSENDEGLDAFAKIVKQWFASNMPCIETKAIDATGRSYQCDCVKQPRGSPAASALEDMLNMWKKQGYVPFTSKRHQEELDACIESECETCFANRYFCVSHPESMPRMIWNSARYHHYMDTATYVSTKRTQGYWYSVANCTK